MLNLPLSAKKMDAAGGGGLLDFAATCAATKRIASDKAESRKSAGATWRGEGLTGERAPKRQRLDGCATCFGCELVRIVILPQGDRHRMTPLRRELQRFHAGGFSTTKWT